MVNVVNGIARDKEIEIEENEDFDAECPELKQYDISSYPADYTVKTLLDNLKGERIILPEFQRNSVWDKIKKSRLIESFLLGLPIPQIFLVRTQKSPKLYIIDGYQRLNALYDFYENKFKLKGVNKNWEGKYYKDLNENDRSFLDESTLRAIIVRQISPKNNDTSMFYIFERLNTGGVVLNPMEIRKALYLGKFYRLLERLNKNPSWRKIIGKKDEDKRLRDIEWILRFFAFYELDVEEEYRAPMKEYLNKFMGEFRNLDDAKGENLETIFRDTCEYISENFGEKPFHYPNRLNLSVMDCVMVSVAKKEDKSNLIEKFEELKNNERFKELLMEVDTSKTRILKERFKISFEIFGVGGVHD